MESHSSPDKKKAFIEAKRKILVSWFENDIWRPISRSKCPKETIIIPAHIRTILQGFKHKNTLESWTQSRPRSPELENTYWFWWHAARDGASAEHILAELLYPSGGRDLWGAFRRQYAETPGRDTGFEKKNR